MKLDVVSRGGRKKDFWYLRELMDDFSLEKMLALHRKRDQTIHDHDAYFLARDAAADLLYALKKIITGENLGRGGNLVIYNDILHESCREAYDMHQVIRHAFLKINPERSQLTVDSSISKTSTAELIQVLPEE